jgi:hypothetical protein
MKIELLSNRFVKIKKKDKNIIITQFKLKVQTKYGKNAEGYVIIKCLSIFFRIPNLKTCRNNDWWIVKFSSGRK